MGACQSACTSTNNTSFNDKDNGIRYRTQHESAFALGVAVKLEPIRKVCEH